MGPTLEVSGQQPLVPPRPSERPTTRRAASGRVLVADDDATTRETLSEIIGDEGYQVVTAKNGAEALVLASRFRPGVLITDVWMPVLDGLSAARLLAAHHPRLRVLLVTADPRPELLRQLERDRVALLRKPLEIDALLEQVAAATAVSRTPFDESAL